MTIILDKSEYDQYSSILRLVLCPAIPAVFYSFRVIKALFCSKSKNPYEKGLLPSRYYSRGEVPFNQ
jgi:hypothetical protein